MAGMWCSYVWECICSSSIFARTDLQTVGARPSPRPTKVRTNNDSCLQISEYWDTRNSCDIKRCVSRLQILNLWWGVRRLWRRRVGECKRSRTPERQNSERGNRGWVSHSTSSHATSIWFVAFMPVPLICLARGGKEKTENWDVGQHEGRKELQREVTSCRGKSPENSVSRPQMSRVAFTCYFSFLEHRRGHFLQLTETKDRQKAPSQQWYASITFSFMIIQMLPWSTKPVIRVNFLKVRFICYLKAK